MKRIKLGLLIAASSLLLTACSGGDDLKSPIILEPETIGGESTSMPEEDGNNGSSEAANPSSDDDTLPPAEGMMRSRLTNEWVDEDVYNTRPIAVMTPNESAAIPHYNLSNASVLYEAPVEGGMTRMLAIYEDWEGLDKIGNVRSLRTYYGYWALEWDAYILHFGGPFFVDEILDKANVEDLDGNLGSDTEAFFRTSDRVAPHNAYAKGSGIKSLIDRKGYSLSYRGLADSQHYNFTTKADPNTLSQYSDAKDATYVNMASCYPSTRCYFEYNADDGLYYRSQHLKGSSDGPHVDAVTGEQLKFKNILIQYMKYEDLGKGYLAFQVHDSQQKGWYITNGKAIPVTWEKNSDFGATRYYDASGQEITLNTGKTMVMIIKQGQDFEFK